MSEKNFKAKLSSSNDFECPSCSLSIPGVQWHCHSRTNNERLKEDLQHLMKKWSRIAESVSSLDCDMHVQSVVEYLDEVFKLMQNAGQHKVKELEERATSPIMFDDPMSGLSPVSDSGSLSPVSESSFDNRGVNGKANKFYGEGLVRTTDGKFVRRSADRHSDHHSRGSDDHSRHSDDPYSRSDNLLKHIEDRLKEIDDRLKRSDDRIKHNDDRLRRRDDRSRLDDDLLRRDDRSRLDEDLLRRQERLRRHADRLRLADERSRLSDDRSRHSDDRSRHSDERSRYSDDRSRSRDLPRTTSRDDRTKRDDLSRSSDKRSRSSDDRLRRTSADSDPKKRKVVDKRPDESAGRDRRKVDKQSEHSTSKSKNLESGRSDALRKKESKLSKPEKIKLCKLRLMARMFKLARRKFMEGTEYDFGSFFHKLSITRKDFRAIANKGVQIKARCISPATLCNPGFSLSQLTPFEMHILNQKIQMFRLATIYIKQNPEIATIPTFLMPYLDKKMKTPLTQPENALLQMSAMHSMQSAQALPIASNYSNQMMHPQNTELINFLNSVMDEGADAQIVSAATPIEEEMKRIEQESLRTGGEGISNQMLKAMQAVDANEIAADSTSSVLDDGKTTTEAVDDSIEEEIYADDEEEIQGGDEEEIQGGVEEEIQGGVEEEIQGGDEEEIQGGDEEEIQGGDEEEIQGGVEEMQGGEEEEIKGGDEEVSTNVEEQNSQAEPTEQSEAKEPLTLVW